MNASRRVADTAQAPVSYLDTDATPGDRDAPAALFVHGLGTSSLLWRNLVPLLQGTRRCLAPDLPLHGETPLHPDQPLSLPALADSCWPRPTRSASTGSTSWPTTPAAPSPRCSRPVPPTGSAR